MTVTVSHAFDSDENLLFSIAKGGNDAEKALKILFSRYRKSLFSFLINQGADTAQVEDLVQEIFIIIFKNAQQYRGDSKASSWIFKIAKNLNIDFKRKLKHEETLDESSWETIADTSIGSPDVGEGGLSQKIQECFNEGFFNYAQHFPDRAEVLAKIIEEKWSTRDVANFLSRSEGATREYLSQCRQKLRKFVKHCRALLTEDSQ